MGSISIRPARRDDVTTLHEMQVDWENEGVTGGYSADLADHISQSLGPYCLVAEKNQEIVGFLSASRRTSEYTGFFPDGEVYVSIDDLYVRPEFRDQGIGARLMEEIFRISEDDGVRRFALSSNTRDFERIVRFYRSCGFETWNVTMFRDVTDG